MQLAALALDSDLLNVCYIAAFVLFILGIRQGTHPSTARRGNMIAAVGMAIAVGATLCTDVIGNWGIIITAIGAGALVGWLASARVAMTDMPQMVALYNGLGGGAVASKRVKMTEMPQMVALYNGLGGGAIALIAWSEYRLSLIHI